MDDIRQTLAEAFALDDATRADLAQRQEENRERQIRRKDFRADLAYRVNENALETETMTARDDWNGWFRRTLTAEMSDGGVLRDTFVELVIALREEVGVQVDALRQEIDALRAEVAKLRIELEALRAERQSYVAS